MPPRKIPETMQAAAIDRFGPPDVLRIHTLPVPAPGPGEVLIAVHAAGVGGWDARRRSGSWAERERFPMVLGADGAGEVVAVGARVRRFRPGDRVWGYEYVNPKGGFYAEYVAISAAHVGRVPRRLDLLQAGAGAVTGLTALQGIERLAARRGDTVLIVGASGAVGTLAVQLARWKGARVLAAASGRDAARLLRGLGAAATVDARRDDVLDELRALAPDGLAAVLALAGGAALTRCLPLLRRGGRLVYPEGVEPRPRRREGLRVIAYNAIAGPRELARLSRAVTGARLRVPIAAVVPLRQASRAHERVERGHVLGRVVLRVRR